MKKEDELKELKRFIDNTNFFDMHSHMAGFELGTPVDDKRPRTLYSILMNDYLAYLSGSCLDRQLVPSRKQAIDGKCSFNDIEPLLRVCRGLTTYYAIREGIRLLHPFKEDDICFQNWKEIDKSIQMAYRKYGERKWQRIACKKLKVLKQVHIATLPYVTTHLDSLPEKEKKSQMELLVLSLVLDGYAFTGFEIQHRAREMSFDIIRKYPRNLQDYLSFCNDVLDVFKKSGGKSVKLLISYFRTLRIENVDEKRAQHLFSIGFDVLSKSALLVLQDFLLKQLLIMANDKGLPLIVHTGYSIPTENGDPENLICLLQDNSLKELKIAISHSGWPNEGKAMIMARTFRNCYFDISWTPLLSQTLGRRILSEALDMVPVNKILVGTDCGTAECFAGTVLLLKNVLYDVLAEKVTKKEFNLETAKSIAKSILWDNPIEFHNLGKRSNYGIRNKEKSRS
ncbi:MAG: amidohydrolase [Candidatus Omnitrophica bacterium]|nr:amidohydrolase [Candidatus Omnitrophota bacterium]MCM8817818.1 amidohydrolase [Candidatus Omnitrophota bacterium]